MKRAFFTLASAIVAAAAQADVLFDNGAPNLVNGNEFTSWLQIEDFKLSKPATITTLRFWEFERINPLDSLDVSFYKKSLYPELPTSLYTLSDVSFTKTPTGRTFNNIYTEYEIVADLGKQSFDSNNTYYVGILGNAKTNPHTFLLDIFWEWTDTGYGQKGLQLPYGNVSWNSTDAEHAFRLEAVPEPTSLVGIGLGILAMVRKRRSR